MVMNGTIVTIKPKNLYISINDHRNEYILFTPNEIATCLVTRNDVYICKKTNNPNLGKKNSEANSCAIKLFNNQATTDCKLSRVAKVTVFTQLKH